MHTATYYIDLLLSGITVGSLSALIAIGYTMVYGIIRLINFAHGDFIMVGGYTMIFTVPLALALGLSDVAQARSGGVRLDSMFIDEGFGSLDEESLRQAMELLSGLAGGSRMIGIISHVGELKNRIDKKIIISKNLTGSSVTIEA